MTTNTVTISLEEYNELRDFKKEIESGKVLVIEDYPNNYLATKRRSFYSDKQIVSELQSLHIRYNEIFAALESLVERSEKIFSVKKMTFWQLMKWWKSLKK